MSAGDNHKKFHCDICGRSGLTIDKVFHTQAGNKLCPRCFVKAQSKTTVQNKLLHTTKTTMVEA